MKIDFSSHRTKDIFANDIGHIIKVYLINPEEKNTYLFEGVLKHISCNSFFIENEDGLIEMFRYEDIRNLKVID